MTTSFSDLMRSGVINDGAYVLTIPEDWMQGRTTYGGLSAAICFEIAKRSFPDLPPLRSAMVSFIGPAGGAVEGKASLLRQGKSVSFVEADVIGEKGLATRTVFAFGVSRQSAFDAIYTPSPTVPALSELEPYMPEGLGPSFANHFETRLVSGGRPMSGSKEHDHFIWVRHKDREAQDLTALLALADMPPPAVMPMFTEFAPISSMTWMINVLNDAPQTEDGWWLLESRAENASSGYSSQDMLIWNSNGELVVAGRQSVAIFT